MVETVVTSKNGNQEDDVPGEAISPDEVKEFGKKLMDNREVPATALSILKVLDRKAITAEHLIETKIGKSLTAVSDQPNPEREQSDNPEILEQITRMKEQLKAKWMKVHQAYKKRQKEAAVASNKLSIAGQNTSAGAAASS